MQRVSRSHHEIVNVNPVLFAQRQILSRTTLRRRAAYFDCPPFSPSSRVSLSQRCCHPLLPMRIASASRHLRGVHWSSPGVCLGAPAPGLLVQLLLPPLWPIRSSTSCYHDSIPVAGSLLRLLQISSALPGLVRMLGKCQRR